MRSPSLLICVMYRAVAPALSSKVFSQSAFEICDFSMCVRSVPGSNNRIVILKVLDRVDRIAAWLNLSLKSELVVAKEDRQEESFSLSP